MKKTEIKKLTLSKETLRSLREDALQEAVAAAPSFYYSRCDTCGIACTQVVC